MISKNEIKRLLKKMINILEGKRKIVYYDGSTKRTLMLNWRWTSYNPYFYSLIFFSVLAMYLVIFNKVGSHVYLFTTSEFFIALWASLSLAWVIDVRTEEDSK